MDGVIVRKEKNMDREPVFQLVRDAFLEAEHSDGTEHKLVERLRKSDAFIPELSLVSIKDDRVVGHIMFTKALVGDNMVLALAPLSVMPEYQNQGIGSLLVKEGHRTARGLGYEFVVVLGSEKYYPRFGYRPADELGIKPPFDVPRENFMAINLTVNTKVIDGVMEYTKEFFEG